MAKLGRLCWPVAMVIAFAATAGCGGDAPKSSSAATDLFETNTPATAPSELPVLGRYEGRWDAASGKLTITPLDDGAAKLKEQGFVAIDDTKVATFVTTAAAYGYSTAPACENGYLCGVVNMTNKSSRTLKSIMVEVDFIDNGVTVSNSNTTFLAANPKYTGLVNAKGLGFWAFGNLSAGGVSSENLLNFQLNGATSFVFRIALRAALERTSYAASAIGTLSDNSETANSTTWADGAPPWRDACEMAGSTTILTNSGIATPYVQVDVPFPWWLYATNTGGITKLRVNASGIVGFGLSNSLTLNSAMSAAPVMSMAPFWDDSLTTSNLGVCYATENPSQIGSRRFVFTWKHATLPAVNGTMSFSVVLQESTDKIFYLYHKFTTADCFSSSETLGSEATIGVKGGSGVYTQISHLAEYLPYSFDCPDVPDSAGAFVALTASPGNIF